MPKLFDWDVERRQLKIEEAALQVFTRRGYHGTSVRDLADQAGVSLGNIYNYYATKEDLFASLVRRYEKRMGEVQRRALKPLLNRLDPTSLRKLARAVRQIVYDNPDYWRLMYIDVVEFGNRHFAHTFRDLAKNLQLLAAESAAEDSSSAPGGNPAPVAFVAIYLQFFTYYLVERLFGGQSHLGVPEDQAIEELIRIYTAGVGKPRQTRSHRR
jgi:AcrR family transcriptional regulator